MKKYVVGFGLSDNTITVYAKSAMKAISAFNINDEPYIVSETEIQVKDETLMVKFEKMAG